MHKYYEVCVTQTCKAIGSKEGYYQWNKERKQFESIALAKAYLKETYGNCKKVPMFVDMPNGQAKKTGYIYCYNTPKVSYDDMPKNNQDWVTVYELKATNVII